MNETRQPNVILATLALDRGGSNEIATTLLRRWPRTRHQVYLCVAVQGAETSAPDVCPDWVIGRIPRIRNVIMVVFSLWKMTKRYDPVAIVSHGYGLNHALIIAKVLRLVHARVIIVEHGDLDGRFAMRPWARRALSKNLTRLLYRRADRVVYVSEVLAKRARLAGMGTEASIVAIPNRIDKQAFFRRSRIRSAEKNPHITHALPHPWVLAVGRLSPEKNPSFLITVMSEYLQANAGSCLILGDGPMRSDLEREVKIRELSTSIHFFGHVSDPAWFMRRADVLILTSLTEARPLVLLQAMACGTAIVAPDHIPGVTEMVSNYEQVRCLSIADKNEWVNAIAELVSLRAGRQWAAQSVATLVVQESEDSDAECLVSDYVSLVDDVVGEKPSFSN